MKIESYNFETAEYEEVEVALESEVIFEEGQQAITLSEYGENNGLSTLEEIVSLLEQAPLSIK